MELLSLVFLSLSAPAADGVVSFKAYADPSCVTVAAVVGALLLRRASPQSRQRRSRPAAISAVRGPVGDVSLAGDGMGHDRPGSLPGAPHGPGFRQMRTPRSATRRDAMRVAGSLRRRGCTTR